MADDTCGGILTELADATTPAEVLLVEMKFAAVEKRQGS